jgi:hypothetical protein
LRESAPEEVLTEAVLREIPVALADMIRRKLLQLTCVIDVEMDLWPLPQKLAETANLPQLFSR